MKNTFPLNGFKFSFFPRPKAIYGRPDGRLPTCTLALNKSGQDIPPFANIFAFSLIGFQFSFLYFPAPRQFSRGRPAGETGDSAGRHGQAGQGAPGAAGQGVWRRARRHARALAAGTAKNRRRQLGISPRGISAAHQKFPPAFSPKFAVWARARGIIAAGPPLPRILS